MDWDVRLKPLLRDFAVSTHTLARTPHSVEGAQLIFDSLPPTSVPTDSPYGDDWDLLWLGHCGANLAEGTDLVLHFNDPSVPLHRHLHGFGGMSPLELMPNHTRVVARRLQDPVCSTAYAVSHRGARTMLHALGVQALDGPYDVMLRSWCDGTGIYESSAMPHVCMGVLPALFKHWRSRGSLAGDSDISKPNEGFRENSVSPEIRWSVRKNLERIWKGDTLFEDQYPDS